MRNCAHWRQTQQLPKRSDLSEWYQSRYLSSILLNYFFQKYGTTTVFTPLGANPSRNDDQRAVITATPIARPFLGAPRGPAKKADIVAITLPTIPPLIPPTNQKVTQYSSRRSENEPPPTERPPTPLENNYDFDDFPAPFKAKEVAEENPADTRQCNPSPK